MASRIASILSVLSLITVVASVGGAGAADAATPKKVTRVLIKKKEHTLTLLAQNGKEEDTIKTYKAAIGPGGMGPKRKEGDMTTPVGRYHITMHQPSQYRIFLRLDYPTAADWKRFTEAKAKGELQKDAKIGGDIGIHGPPTSFTGDEAKMLKEHDWTAGCIAVNDDEIKEIAALVKDGTIVDIED